ncbi:MAG TPA: tRNA lysidine(34) synthetase TilS [Candidatus Saccharimonadales bacterium]|nr:tRNA lysidine(34) synthetase TilS [Candidatus Saccharimonadales bacterium]
MRISVGAGTYVVAVSGGVDSMVLLDLLRQRPGMRLIVAHYDHGIRPDSAEDRKLVQKTAQAHELPFVHEAGKLGAGTSEARARKARYAFLERVRSASEARAIITAHHQDDMLETAIFNLLRGSGRRGLVALKSTDDIVRPLLEYDKEQILDYARSHSLQWREDPTNADIKYTRNYIRSRILPKFTPGQRAELLILLERLSAINDELDVHLSGLLHIQPALNEIDRAWFIHLPHDISREVVHEWLRRHKIRDITKKTIERLVVAMKTGRGGQRVDIDDKHVLEIRRDSLTIVPRDTKPAARKKAALFVRTDGRLTRKK